MRWMPPRSAVADRPPGVLLQHLFAHEHRGRDILGHGVVGDPNTTIRKQGQDRPNLIYIIRHGGRGGEDDPRVMGQHDQSKELLIDAVDVHSLVFDVVDLVHDDDRVAVSLIDLIVGHVLQPIVELDVRIHRKDLLVVEGSVHRLVAHWCKSIYYI